jgi:hypothetical protein
MSRKHCKRRTTPAEGARSRPGSATCKRCPRKGIAVTPRGDRRRALDRCGWWSSPPSSPSAKGRATKKDWAAIADLSNIAETLAATASAATKSCLSSRRCRRRSAPRTTGSRLASTSAFDGPGLQAARDLAEFHDLQRAASAAPSTSARSEDCGPDPVEPPVREGRHRLTGQRKRSTSMFSNDGNEDEKRGIEERVHEDGCARHRPRPGARASRVREQRGALQDRSQGRSRETGPGRP